MAIHLLQEFLNTPLLMTPERAKQLLSVLEFRDRDPSAFKAMVNQPEPEKALLGELIRVGNGFAYQIVNGVAVITVASTLIHRGSWIDAMSGLMTFDDLIHVYKHAISNPDVKAVIGDYDCPGSTVAGAFDAAEELYQLRGHKPMVAIANDLAASGGMLLASAHDEVLVTRTGYVGSIGVVNGHMSYKDKLEKDGMKHTFIYAGKHKVDGNPYEDLPESVKADFQATIDDTYNLFVSTVSKHMELDEQLIRDTEARVYVGQKAVNAQLASRVTSLDAEIHRLSQTPKSKTSTSTLSTQEAAMPEETPPENEPQVSTGFSAKDCLAITQACNESGFPEMASTYIKGEMSIEQVNTDLERLSVIKQSVNIANSNGAELSFDDFKGFGAKVALDKIQNTLAARSVPINNEVTTKQMADECSTDKKAISSAWGDAIESTGGQ